MVLVVSHSLGGCRAGEIQVDVPDQLEGVVVDQDTGERLTDVNVIVYVTELQTLSIPGPEGTPRPRDRIVMGARTGIDGQFKIDLREAKSELNANYPGKDFNVGQIVASKRGYLTLAAVYTNAGSQVLRLKKKTK